MKRLKFFVQRNRKIFFFNSKTLNKQERRREIIKLGPIKVAPFSVLIVEENDSLRITVNMRFGRFFAINTGCVQKDRDCIHKK